MDAHYETIKGISISIESMRYNLYQVTFGDDITVCGSEKEAKEWLASKFRKNKLLTEEEIKAFLC